MSNGGLKILLVDDQQLMRQGLRQLVEARPGLTVVGEASCSKSAIESDHDMLWWSDLGNLGNWRACIEQRSGCVG
jgi:DNA-binding LytR/AlgR family response regulator